MRRLFYLIVLQAVLTVSHAEQIYPLYGSQLPTIHSSSPIYHSKSYATELTLKPGYQTHQLLIEPGKVNVLYAFTDAIRSIEYVNSLGVAQTLEPDSRLESVDLGHRWVIKDVNANNIMLKITASKSGNVVFVVTTPDSDLILKAKGTPSLAKVNQTTSIRIWFDKPEMIEAMKVTGQLMQHKFISFSREGDQYVAKFALDGVQEKEQRSLPIKILVNGRTNDNKRFERHLEFSLPFVETKAGFARAIEVNALGALEVAMKRASGKYRLDIYYGRDNMALARISHWLTLDDKEHLMTIRRPAELETANQAVIKLIDLNSFALVDAERVELPASGELDELAFEQIKKAPLTTKMREAMLRQQERARNHSHQH